MKTFGGIITLVGIIVLVIACFLSVKKMQKMQDISFRQKNPQEYKKLKSDIKSYIFLAIGILMFIIGFILLNFA